jgi:hypothetical protein
MLRMNLALASRIGLIGAALVLMAACKESATSPWALGDFGRHGRYVGVGIYGPGRQWARMVAAQQASGEAPARPIDDQAIIVMSDTDTGELRACGDLTGYCIGMNPWKQPLTPAQIAPIELTSHVKSDDPSLTIEGAPASPRRRPPYRPASSPRAPPAAAPARS